MGSEMGWDLSEGGGLVSSAIACGSVDVDLGVVV